MMVYNKVNLTGYCRRGGGHVTIGNDFHMTSGDAINPICRNIRACIHLGSPKASITIGNHVGMSSPCIWVNERLTIGNNVNIGGNCMILDTDTHQIDYLARRGQKAANLDDPKTTVQTAPVTIGSDVWIGLDVNLIGGVSIGDGAVVLSRAVVTKDVPPYAIVGGIPARIIGYRYDNDTIDFLLKTKWWNNTPDWFKDNWRLMCDIDSLKAYYNHE